MGLFFSPQSVQGQGSTGTSTSVACLSTSPATPLVPVNLDRRFLALQNLGTKTVFIGFANTVTASTYAIALAAGVLYEFPVAYTGALWAISATGSQPVVIVEIST